MALLGLVALAAVAAVLSSTGSGTPTASTHAASHHKSASKAAVHHPATTSATSGSAQPTTPATSSAPSTPAATSPTANGSPAAAVEDFYELAAHHQYQPAWALADPAFRNQLGGYNSFEQGQSGDRQIIFHQAQVTNRSAQSATVAVRTTSIRDNGTQQCSGTVALVPSGSHWLLHQISINCTSPH